MKYLSIYFQNGVDFDGVKYGAVDIDCNTFTRPDKSRDVVIVNGAIIRLPGTIVDVRSRMKAGGG